MIAMVDTSALLRYGRPCHISWGIVKPSSIVSLCVPPALADLSLSDIDLVPFHLLEGVDRYTLACKCIMMHDENNETSVRGGDTSSSNMWMLLHHMVINTLNIDELICMFDNMTICSSDA